MTPSSEDPGRSPNLYNQIAGQSVDRLAALSDGVFAVAMTLLVLDLKVPLAAAIHGERDLWQALLVLGPQLLLYLMSFLTLGIFWVGQQTQLNHLARSDRSLTWIHLAFLCGVSLVPFSTGLLIEFIAYRTALLLYWSNLVALGGALYASWLCATASGLLQKDLGPEIPRAIKRRILTAQAFYFAGMLLCIVRTRWSIAAIILVQLNYALAPALALVRLRLSRSGR